MYNNLLTMSKEQLTPCSTAENSTLKTDKDESPYRPVANAPLSNEVISDTTDSSQEITSIFIKQEIEEEEEGKEAEEKEEEEEEEKELTVLENNVIYIKEEVHFDVEQNTVDCLKQNQDMEDQPHVEIPETIHTGMNSVPWTEPIAPMLLDKKPNHEQYSCSESVGPYQRQFSSELMGDLPGRVGAQPQLQATVNTYCFQHSSVHCTHARDKLVTQSEGKQLFRDTGAIGFSFTSNSKVHKQIYTESKPFQCTLCEYSSSWACALKRHLATHTGHRPFKCTVCSYSSSQPGHLKKHMATHTGDRPYKCTLCSYTSSQPGHLKRHIMATHVDDKPFQCDLCSYRSSLAGALKRHMNTHVQDKPFKCTLCTYSTFQASDLKTHETNHRGEKPFSCPRCDYKTAFKSNIGKHLRTHSGDKPFHCTDCSYTCGDRTSLVSHTMRRHSDMRPYGCAHCQHRTVTKSDLIRHLKNKHKFNRS